MQLLDVVSQVSSDERSNPNHVSLRIVYDNDSKLMQFVSEAITSQELKSKVGASMHLKAQRQMGVRFVMIECSKNGAVGFMEINAHPRVFFQEYVSTVKHLSALSVSRLDNHHTLSEVKRTRIKQLMNDKAQREQFEDEADLMMSFFDGYSDVSFVFVTPKMRHHNYARQAVANSLLLCGKIMARVSVHDVSYASLALSAGLVLYDQCGSADHHLLNGVSIYYS